MEIVKFFTASCIVPLIFIIFTTAGVTEQAGDSFQNTTCTGIKECAAINGSVCESDLCACPESLPIFVNVTADEGYCLESLNLTQTNCSFSQQCNYSHGSCVQGTCACEDRYIAKNNGECGEMKKNPLVPIIVGSLIAAAIIGTLIAYVVMNKKK